MNPKEEAKKLARDYGVIFKPGELEKYTKERETRRANTEINAIKRKAELLGQPRLPSPSQNKVSVSSGVWGPARGSSVLAEMYKRFTQGIGGKRSKKSKRRISRRRRRTRRH